MSTNAEQWNALTPELLRSRGSNKWTAPEGELLCAGVAEMDYGTAPCLRNGPRSPSDSASATPMSQSPSK